MIRMSGITEERWQENPHELGLMALFYVAGFVALKYERRLDLGLNFVCTFVFMFYKSLVGNYSGCYIPHLNCFFNLFV